MIEKIVFKDNKLTITMSGNNYEYDAKLLSTIMFNNNENTKGTAKIKFSIDKGKDNDRRRMEQIMDSD